MPTPRSKTTRKTRVHDNPRRPKRAEEPWFDQQFMEYFGKKWDPAETNQQVKQEKTMPYCPSCDKELTDEDHRMGDGEYQCDTCGYLTEDDDE